MKVTWIRLQQVVTSHNVSKEKSCVRVPQTLETPLQLFNHCSAASLAGSGQDSARGWIGLCVIQIKTTDLFQIMTSSPEVFSGLFYLIY